MYASDEHLATGTASTFTHLRWIGPVTDSTGSASVDARFDDFALYLADCGVSARGIDFGTGRAAVHRGPVSPERQR